MILKIRWLSSMKSRDDFEIKQMIKYDLSTFNDQL